MKNILSAQSKEYQSTSTTRSKIREFVPKDMFQRSTDFFELIGKIFRHLIEENSWQDRVVNLSEVGRDDLNNQSTIDKVQLLEAQFLGSRGQAFAHLHNEIPGTSRTLAGICEMKAGDTYRSAILLATLNAVARHLGIVDRTVGCQNEERRKCAKELVSYIKSTFGKPRVALIGADSGMVQELSREFDLRIMDTGRNNAGIALWGIPVLSTKRTADHIAWSDLILVIESGLTNETLQALVRENPAIAYTRCRSGRILPKISLNAVFKRPTIFCGVTSAAAAHFLMLPRFCPYGS